MNKYNIKWIVGLLLLLTGVSSLAQGGFVSSIFYIIGGLICVPPLYEFFEKKTKVQFLSWHKYLIVIISLVLGGITSPKIFKDGATLNKGGRNGIDSTSKADIEGEKTIFSIDGDEVGLRLGAGNQFDKVINKKATDALGKIEYCKVDYTTKVKVIEELGEWSKIQVVDPEWLSASHIGWIPTRNIIKYNFNESLPDLNESEYEIIKTKHNSTVENFHVLITKDQFDEDYLHEFTQRFRKKNCTMNCNIFLYDTKSIKSLIGVYPLNQEQYIELADHLLAISTFDATEVKSWYPYQDLQYKKYGGRNWKKNPVQ